MSAWVLSQSVFNPLSFAWWTLNCYWSIKVFVGFLSLLFHFLFSLKSFPENLVRKCNVQQEERWSSGNLYFCCTLKIFASGKRFLGAAEISEIWENGVITWHQLLSSNICCGSKPHKESCLSSWIFWTARTSVVRLQRLQSRGNLTF